MSYDAFFDEEWFDDPDDCDTADYLAEQVNPSPVWVSYDPDWDIESPATDCEEYFFDEYYDEEGKLVRKKKDEKEETGVSKTSSQIGAPRAKGKLISTKDIPELKLPERRRSVLEPTVIWRSRNREVSRSPPLEIVAEGRGRKVSLLSDWRERFNIKTPDLDTKQSHHVFEIETPSMKTPLAANGTLGDVCAIIPKPPDIDEEHRQGATENSCISAEKKYMISQSEILPLENQTSPVAIQQKASLHLDSKDGMVTQSSNVEIADAAEGTREELTALRQLSDTSQRSPNGLKALKK